MSQGSFPFLEWITVMCFIQEICRVFLYTSLTVVNSCKGKMFWRGSMGLETTSRMKPYESRGSEAGTIAVTAHVTQLYSQVKWNKLFDKDFYRVIFQQNFQSGKNTGSGQKTLKNELSRPALHSYQRVEKDEVGNTDGRSISLSN